ncbi:hypothetical protein N657DRAFT_645557 [Parathielavia appendiculata]|uniref:Uncharacterized protein n=1 Tax=Parathielavia appendiculata TaxID=2587402 RepID=A0AAN6U039_9PEZI|nr:hypothetical protein N657DRAFT_645557 [Parathielavia appendiculata]
MASFSRGLGPRLVFLIRQQAPCECAAAEAQVRQLLRARFSTARLLQKAARSSRPVPKPASKPSASTAAPKTSSPILGSATAQAARPATYAEQLALKGRTLLYESPSHFWFRAGCFSSAAFCVSYTVYQYWTVILHPPEGLMWWIPHAFGAILVFMAGMGAYFVMGAGRLVRSIEAVPAAAVVAAKQIAAAGAAASQTPPIYIEVATRRIVPFMPPKKTLLRPEEVQLPFRMYSVFAGSGSRLAVAAAAGHENLAQKPVSLAERVRAERAAREAKIAERKYTMDHIMTAPFRDAAKAFGTAWRGIKRSFNREGFAKIQLGKQEYKLDVTGGWALDDGRAMDRLLPIRPNALRAR